MYEKRDLCLSKHSLNINEYFAAGYKYVSVF